MKINPNKAKIMEITFIRTHYDTPPPVSMCNQSLESVTTFKLLGIMLSDLTWGAHVDYLYRKCSRRLYLLASHATRDILRIYLTMIRSVLEYACQVWHTSLSGAHSDKLESVRRPALHIIYPDLSYGTTPRHFLSLVCLTCPNAERICAQLPSRTCYPHCTDYTTSSM